MIINEITLPPEQVDPKNQKMASFTTDSGSEAKKIKIDKEINKNSGEAEKG